MIRLNRIRKSVENLNGFIEPLIGFVDSFVESHDSMIDEEFVEIRWFNVVGCTIKGAERSREMDCSPISITPKVVCYVEFTPS
jgi:hypothetical protein